MGHEEVRALREELAAQEARVLADAVTAYLSVSDAACGACGYNLRGATSGVCSECGAPIRFNEMLPGAAGAGGGGRPAPMWQRVMGLCAAGVFAARYVWTLVMMTAAGVWGYGYGALYMGTVVVLTVTAVGAVVMGLRSLGAKQAAASYAGMRWLMFMAAGEAVVAVVQFASGGRWWW